MEEQNKDGGTENKMEEQMTRLRNRKQDGGTENNIEK